MNFSAAAQSIRLNAGSKGFTLLELLIALVIFSLLAVMAYSGLNQVLIAQQRTEAQAKRLTEVQHTFTLLEHDIEQTVAREIRDAYGDPQPALIGNIYGDYLLELTHTGWRNPANNPRSNLQRVAYSVRDGKLHRYLWYMLDRAQDSVPFDMLLMEDVKEFEFRYMDKGQEWHTSWPDDLSSSTPDRSPPRAVEVSITTDDFGKITRRYRVPG